MAMFKAFKPSGMEKIARAMGYQGNMQGFQDYLAQDPMRQQQMQTYQNKAMQMAKGGVVQKFQVGGTPKSLQQQLEQVNMQIASATDNEARGPLQEQAANLQRQINAMNTPAVPLTTQAVGFSPAVQGGLFGSPVTTPEANMLQASPGVLVYGPDGQHRAGHDVRDERPGGAGPGDRHDPVAPPQRLPGDDEQ